MCNLSVTTGVGMIASESTGSEMVAVTTGTAGTTDMVTGVTTDMGTGAVIVTAGRGVVTGLLTAVAMGVAVTAIAMATVMVTDTAAEGDLAVTMEGENLHMGAALVGCARVVSGA